MPMITRPFAAYLACSRDMAAKDALHGAHHEAQKSTNTTFPVVLGRAAPGSNLLRLGMGDPTVGAADATMVRLMQTAMMTLRMCFMVSCVWCDSFSGGLNLVF